MSERIYGKRELDYSEIKELKTIAKIELGWDKVIGELWDSSNAFIRTEIANRGKNRAKILKMKEKEKTYDRWEKSYHILSVGHLKKTLELIDESVETLGDEKINQLEKIKDNVAPLHNEALDFIKESLLEEDIEPEIAGEIVDIYEELVKIVEADGFKGLVNNIKKNLNELIEVRSDESRNRGRDEKHSPLPWWKWLIIAGVIGAGAGAIIGCLIWYGCTWLITVVTRICRWVITLVNMGC